MEINQSKPGQEFFEKSAPTNFDYLNPLPHNPDASKSYSESKPINIQSPGSVSLSGSLLKHSSEQSPSGVYIFSPNQLPRKNRVENIESIDCTTHRNLLENTDLKPIGKYQSLPNYSFNKDPSDSIDSSTPNNTACVNEDDCIQLNEDLGDAINHVEDRCDTHKEAYMLIEPTREKTDSTEDTLLFDLEMYDASNNHDPLEENGVILASNCINNSAKLSSEPNRVAEKPRKYSTSSIIPETHKSAYLRSHSVDILETKPIQIEKNILQKPPQASVPKEVFFSPTKDKKNRKKIHYL